MPFTQNRLWLGMALTLLLGLFLVGLTAPAAEEAPKATIPALELKSNAPADSDTPANPFVVPDGTPEELLAYLKSLRELKPPMGDREAMKAFAQKGFHATVEAANKILAAKPNEKQAMAAAGAKMGAMLGLKQIGDETADTLIQQFPAQLTGAGFPEIAKRVEGVVLQIELRTAAQKGPEEVKEIYEGIKKRIASGAPTPETLQLASMTARVLEMTRQTGLAAEAYAEFGKVFSTSDNPRVAQVGKQMLGAARRMNSVGKKIELTGTYLNGKPFEWTPYEGKVVLVMFWATWCGPCKAEIPNVEKYYELYRDRGFDVIAVSCDKDRRDLEDFVEEENLPWPNLFENDPQKQGFDNPNVIHYGIMGVPTMMLVGKDGNVVSLQARGPKLGEELARLLGPAKSAEEEKPASGS